MSLAPELSLVPLRIDFVSQANDIPLEVASRRDSLGITFGGEGKPTRIAIFDQLVRADSVDAVDFVRLLRAVAIHESIHVALIWLGVPGMFDHGHDFVRMAAHMCHRAGRIGIDMDLCDILPPGAYSLQHPTRYSFGLGREPEEMANMPMQIILHSPPPVGFARLWLHDSADQERGRDNGYSEYVA